MYTLTLFYSKAATTNQRVLAFATLKEAKRRAEIYDKTNQPYMICDAMGEEIVGTISDIDPKELAW